MSNPDGPDRPANPLLTVDQDMTDEFEGMVETWPKALGTLKALCESGAHPAALATDQRPPN